MVRVVVVVIISSETASGVDTAEPTAAIGEGIDAVAAAVVAADDGLLESSVFDGD